MKLLEDHVNNAHGQALAEEIQSQPHLRPTPPLHYETTIEPSMGSRTRIPKY